MTVEKEEDPFASVIRLCRLTASQETKFRNCPLFGQSANIPDPYLEEPSSSPEPTPSEPTEIVMVSPPASASSSLRQTEDEDMVFLTPPEHHNHSHISSSEDELLCAKGVRNRYDVSKKVRVSAGESDDEADSKESRVSIEVYDGETVTVGETEEIVIETPANKGAHSATDDDEVLVVEDNEDSGEEIDESNSNKDSLGAINLGQKNCDSMEGKGGGGGGASVAENNSYSAGSLNSSKIDDDVFKLKCIAEGGGNGCSDMREEEISVNKVIEDPKDGYSNGGLKKDDGERIGEIDEVSDGDVRKKRTCSRDVGGSSTTKRRKSPSSLDGKDENVVDDETVAESKEGGLLDFVSILNVIFVGDDKDGVCHEDVDFLEMAKRRGLTFPRPRWWPPEAEGGDRQ